MARACFPIFEKAVYDGYMARLLRYLDHETNMLIMKRVRGRVQAMVARDMRKIFGDVTRQTVSNFLNDAFTRNIIQYIEADKCFYVNPELFLNGEGIAEGVDELFWGSLGQEETKARG